MTIYRIDTWTADGGGLRSWQQRTYRLYADGGSILRNPSAIGGTWAWVAVDQEGWTIHHEHGWFEPPLPEEGGRAADSEGLPTTGNNQSEFLAVLLALRAVKATMPSWGGMICTDSKLTIDRWSRGTSLRGIPTIWHQRMGEILRMPGEIGRPMHWQLLDGHPTVAQLLAGRGKRGNPTSTHNEQCDALCQEASRVARTGAPHQWTVMDLDPLDNYSRIEVRST